MYKNVICSNLECAPSGKTSPVDPAELETDGSELSNFLQSCSIFDVKEIQTPWLTSQGVIARDIILKRVQRDLPQVLGEKFKLEI